jgi:peptidoglycan/LPS O-acetylase OafA/YrhL
MNQTEPLKAVTTDLESDAGSDSSRTFFRIASLGTAIGFGCAAASTESLRSSPAGFSFQITAGTFVAFAIGAAIAIFYWRLVVHNSPAVRRSSVLLALGGVGLFLYPLRFMPSRNLPELAIGLVSATLALSLVAFLLWKVKRFLDSDERRGEAATNSACPPAPITK